MEIQPVGDMHAFIASLAERADRIRMYRLSSAPEIGIFWLNPTKTKILYGNCIPMPEGLDHGDFKISAVDHFSEWERLNKDGFLKEQGLPKSLRDDYALVPRGRVSYNKVTSRYEVYIGNWLQPKHKALINSYFRLPFSATDYIPDEHYNL